jgi:nucleotide-binding universal stress UspA family protein
MFKRILVSTDRSSLSSKAIHAAIELAKDSGAQLVGVTVVPPFKYAGMAGYAAEAYDGHHSEVLMQAEACLHGLREAAQQAQVDCAVVTKETDTPWEGIVETASEQGCDLIVMATRPRSGLQALIGRSQTQEVLKHSPLPVLVYR